VALDPTCTIFNIFLFSMSELHNFLSHVPASDSCRQRAYNFHSPRLNLTQCEDTGWSNACLFKACQVPLNIVRLHKTLNDSERVSHSGLASEDLCDSAVGWTLHPIEKTFPIIITEKVFFQLVCVSRKIEICQEKKENDVKP
jgi:hypothetical protein